MNWLDHYSVLQVFGALCVILFLFVMVRAHLSAKSKIDLTDLLTEWAAGKRRITMSRFTAFGGFLIGSWAFVSATVSNTLASSWEGILAYMGICFGYRIGDSYLKNQRDATAAEAPAGTTTTTTLAVEQTDTKKKGGILS